MSNPEPRSNIIARTVQRNNPHEQVIGDAVGAVVGEVALDAYVKAQISAPEVTERILELENCIYQLCTGIFALADIDKHRELRLAAEDAASVLKNHLEVDSSKYRIRTELGSLK